MDGAILGCGVLHRCVNHVLSSTVAASVRKNQLHEYCQQGCKERSVHDDACILYGACKKLKLS